MDTAARTRVAKEREGSVRSLPQQNMDSDIWVPDYLAPSWVCLPNDQPFLAIIRPGETALEVLSSVCKTHKLETSSHYLRLKVWVDHQMLIYVPKLEEEISDVLYKEIEISPKATKVVRFDKYESCTAGYGFSVAVIDEDGTQQLHITEVKPDGLAAAKGIRAGDEILFLNGKSACALDMEDMRGAFVNQAVTLTVSVLPQLDPRTVCPAPPRRTYGEQDTSTDIFSQSQEYILDEVSGLTVASLNETLDSPLQLQSPSDPDDPACITIGQRSSEQVIGFCRSLSDINTPEASSSSSSSSSLSPSPVSAAPPAVGTATQKQLTHADKLRKVINELVDTEKTYVKDLRFLIDCYLKPLQKDSILTQDELDVLFGNLGEMADFQVEFLRTLEDGIRLVPDLDCLERVEHFKKVLFSLGGSFLYYADRFKIYSAFCASHTKVPKVLAKAKTDPDFKAFLAERNPRQQHSSTLESYLIKPIQRVLKYPLLLRELYSLTEPDSEEHYHLDVAMKAMNKVASHINEMQKLHEEYGAVFDQLISEQTANKKVVPDLSMGDLLLHSTVTWINAPSSLVKSKKDPELAAFVFKTAVVFVYKESSKHRKKIGTSHRASVNEDKVPFRFRHMISTDTLQVRVPANSESTAMCEIVHTRSESEGRPETTFQLCCRSPESKKDFLKAVHSTIRDKRRLQLLKTESLPLNQQYVPFGGKRLCALKARPSMTKAASAPSRTLRKLVRNRFTIDTDLIFHGNNNSQDSDPSDPSHNPSSCSMPSQHALLQPRKPQGEDTDRWVEEQFNLGSYEEQATVTQVKETDILSDDDEYCSSVRPASTELIDLEAKMNELDIETERNCNDAGQMNSISSCSVALSHSPAPSLKVAPRKQCAVEEATNMDHKIIWVRRDDRCNGDVF